MKKLIQRYEVILSAMAFAATIAAIFCLAIYSTLELVILFTKLFKSL
jgi:hypothetical protein